MSSSYGSSDGDDVESKPFFLFAEVVTFPLDGFAGFCFAKHCRGVSWFAYLLRIRLGDEEEAEGWIDIGDLLRYVTRVSSSLSSEESLKMGKLVFALLGFNFDRWAERR